MPHLVEPFYNKSYDYALEQLNNAHKFLVSRTQKQIETLQDPSQWGILTKRMAIELGHLK